MIQNANEILHVGAEIFPVGEAVWTNDETGWHDLRGHMKGAGELRYTVIPTPFFACGEEVAA